MKILLLLPILLTLLTADQIPTPASESTPLTVVSFKWSRSRRTVETQESAATTPAPAMIPANKTFARNGRVNNPPGVGDPNTETVDGRSAAMDKIVQDSRTPKGKPTDGFVYRVKVRNLSDQVVEAVFWEYQFYDPADPALVARRQFLCDVNIRADKEKELEGFSLAGPGDVLDVGILAGKPANHFKERILINRVEYANRTVWLRKDWSFSEVKTSYDRVLREPWLPGMCKGL